MDCNAERYTFTAAPVSMELAHYYTAVTSSLKPVFKTVHYWQPLGMPNTDESIF